MRITPTDLPGVMLIELEPIEDERGWFARTFCRDAFAALGMNPDIVQANISHNARAGTLRGMHYQAPPHGESKVVSVMRGAAFDVAVDVRPNSPTRGRWTGHELTQNNHRALYIPAGFAHGFVTLADDTQVHYLMGHAYVPDAARGVRYNDPSFGIEWPHTEQLIVSERDANWPNFDPRS